LLGVISHAGHIRAVLDLARVLGLPQVEGAPGGGAYVLLLRNGQGQEVGLRVGAVEAIRPVAPADLLPLEELAGAGAAPTTPFPGLRCARLGLIVLSTQALWAHVSREG
jgi:chemotaxis signal transduction protein